MPPATPDLQELALFDELDSRDELWPTHEMNNTDLTGIPEWLLYTRDEWVRAVEVARKKASVTGE